MQVLKPLGIELIMEAKSPSGQTWCGLGKNQKPEFWFGEADVVEQHIAFHANSRKEVGAFYQAAINAGGKDHGEPGIREICHPNYDGGFIIDLNGYNIEAVCHSPGVA